MGRPPELLPRHRCTTLAHCRRHHRRPGLQREPGVTGQCRDNTPDGQTCLITQAVTRTVSTHRILGHADDRVATDMPRVGRLQIPALARERQPQRRPSTPAEDRRLVAAARTTGSERRSYSRVLGSARLLWTARSFLGPPLRFAESPGSTDCERLDSLMPAQWGCWVAAAPSRALS